MSADKNLDALYTIGNQLAGDALLSVHSAQADPAAFDYGTLYACTQVRAATPAEREAGIEHFLRKIREKNLDNETIRTILETQEAKLPDGELLLMRATDLVSYQYFQAHRRHVLYLNHPAIRAVFDTGVSAGAPACLCEQIRGALDRNAVLALSYEEKLEIVRQAALAVEVLHRQGLAHGALRPGQFSVLRAESGLQVRLTVLGMIPDLEGALMAGGGEELKPLFAYTAPLQLAGAAPCDAADIYSLGGYLYYLLTGAEPWAQTRTLFDLLEALKAGEQAYDTQELELLPPAVRSILLATELEGAQRYQSIGQLLSDLEACRNGQPVLAAQLLQAAAAATTPQASGDDVLPKVVSPATIPVAPAAPVAPAMSEGSAAGVNPLAGAQTQIMSRAPGDGSQIVNVLDTDESGDEVSLVQTAGSPAQPATAAHAPLFAEPVEPQMFNISDLNAGMNTVGRNTMLKVVATVAVLAVCAGAGYYFSGSGRSGANAVSGSAENTPPANITSTPAPADSGAPKIAISDPQAGASIEALLKQGNAALQAKDYAAAVVAFAEAQKLKPSAETEGLLKTAQGALERAQKRDASLALAQQMIAAGNLDSAETALLGVLSLPGYEKDEQATALQKSILDTRYRAALAEGQRLLGQKSWKEASASFAWALSIRGYENDPLAMQGKSQADAELAKADQARIRQEQETAQRAARFQTALAGAQQMAAAGRWDEAAAAYDMALQIEGYSADPAALAGRAKARAAAREKQQRYEQRKNAALKARYEALLERGRILLQARQWSRAEDAFNQAGSLEGYAGSPLAQDGRTRAIQGSASESDRVKYDNLLLEGMKRIVEKKYAEADQTFREALKVRGLEGGTVARQLLMFAGTMQKEAGRSTEYADSIRRGDELMAKQQAQEAVQEYGRAMIADPAKPDAALRRAMAYYKAGNLDKALDSFNRILEKSPGLPDALAGEALVLLQQEKYTAALEDMAQLAQSPAASPAHKAWSEGAQGWLLFNPAGRGLRRPGVEMDNNKAVEHLRAAAEAGDAEAANNLALAFWRGKGAERDEKLALELLERSAKAGCVQALFNLGLFYYTAGGKDRDYGKAAEFFQKAAEAGYPRAYGRLADLYQRGRGVEKNQEKARELLAKNENRTDKDDDPALALPGLSFFKPKPVEDVRQNMKGELDQQFRAIMDEGRKLLQKQEPAAARRTFVLAQLLEGFEGNPQLKEALAAAQQMQQEQEAVAERLQPLPPLTVAVEEPTDVPAPKADPSAPRLPDLKEPNLAQPAAAPASPSDPTTSAAPTSPAAPAAPAIPGIAANLFQKEYNALMSEGKALLTQQKWTAAEQAFRMAAALPGMSDVTAAEAGLKSALDGRRNAPGGANPSDFEAIVQQGSNKLRDRQWPQAIHLYQYALSMEGFKNDPVAKIGEGVALKTQDAVALAQLQPQQEPKIPAGGERDMDSYRVAINQAQTFLTQKNYNAAEQLAKIILGMKGFEDDPVARQILSAAQSGIAQEQNSPEARAINRTKNAKLYQDLILAAKMHLNNQAWEQAEKVLTMALKLPGYDNDPEAVQMLGVAKSRTLPTEGPAQANNPNAAPGVIQEGAPDAEAVRHKAEFDAIFGEARRLFDLGQYEAAESIAGEALKVKGYAANAEALNLQAKAGALKPKPQAAPTPPKTESAQADPRQQAQFLLQEGDAKRQNKDLPGAIQNYSSGIDLDPENLQLRINRGDTYAAAGQFNLALSDYERALKAPGLTAEQQGYINNNLANVYYYGLSEPAKAVEFYRKAATEGNAAAMNSLGVCYGSGRGVEKDPAQALQWYKEAANKEYANAMLNLGLAYQNGWGTQPDNTQAFRWYDQAAKRNVPRAFQRLAIMYREGLGVEKDEAKAVDNEKKARALGYNKDR